VDCFLTVYTCFTLTMQNYWKRKDRTKTNLQELNELIATRFRGIREWVGTEEYSRPVVERNIAVGFYVLNRLDKYIEYFKAEGTGPDGVCQFRQVLAWSLLERRDYEAVIALLEGNAIQAPYAFFLASRKKSEETKGIKKLEACLDRYPRSRDLIQCVYWAYEETGNVEALLQVLRGLASGGTSIDSQMVLSSLPKACQKRGEYADAISASQELVSGH
jgi:hypothetical protein